MKRKTAQIRAGLEKSLKIAGVAMPQSYARDMATGELACRSYLAALAQMLGFAGENG
jgi:hypothetical protein